MELSKELKEIKKRYGEKFMHLCREMFPTILENEGKLLSILESSFATNSRSLYDDLKEHDKTGRFKELIYEKANEDQKQENAEEEISPYELLSEAGYDLYECTTEEEIQRFKNYYAPNEELCTFKGGRLDSCVVFWAVKKNVEEIRRDDFDLPQREDEYGTSVMSIQFSKTKPCTVSIKNRYNHVVKNPDATFGNDLDRIIPGLGMSFRKLLEKRGLDFVTSNKDKIDIPGYTIAADGKYYKYNFESNGRYYCPGNIVIDHGHVIKLEPEKQELIDCFILDKEKKTLRLYNPLDYDSFTDALTDLEKIDIQKNTDGEKGSRTITIIKKNCKYPIVIEVDKNNEIIGYQNHNLKKVAGYFLDKNRKLKKLDTPNLTDSGIEFLASNDCLEELSLPSLENAGGGFLRRK